MPQSRPHQPMADVVEHKQPDAAQLEAVCGKSVAVVLAKSWATTPLKVMFDEEGKEPFICEEGPRPLQQFEGQALLTTAVETALKSRFAAVEVLLVEPGDNEKQARKAVSAAGSDVAVEILPASELASAAKEACSFELFGLPKAILDAGSQALQRCPQATSVTFMSCDMPRITPWHLHALCQKFDTTPGVDVVQSWIYWLTRLPLVVSRSFIEGLGESPLCKPANNGCDRPLPMIEVAEVVFGEEKLHSGDTESAEHARFFKEVSLSAREAMRLARGMAVAQGDEEKALKARYEALNDADALMVDTATGLMKSLDKAKATYADDLEKWDAWARRNERDFPLIMDKKHKGRLAYVDSAATSQRLAQAIQAQLDFDTHENANIYRGTYELSMGSTISFNNARAVIEDHLGAERRSVIFTANTSASVELAAMAWGLRNLHEGDVILVGFMEHHSNMMPWRMVAAERGARVEYIPYGPDGRIDQEAYARLLGLKPRLVCVAQVSNVMGLINPVSDMAAQAHAVGARFFLDAAQSFPHMRMKVDGLGADFVAFSGHKAYGPMGTGGLWMGKAAFEEADPIAVGGGSISHVGKDSYYLRVGAIQHELGTPAVAQAIGLAAAVEHMDMLGMDAIEEHSRTLTRYLVDALHLVDGVTVWGDHCAPDGLNGLVTFSAHCIAPARVSTDMGLLQVCIRAGGQCALPLHAAMGIQGTGRISLGIHNTVEDVEASVLALAMSVKLAEM